VAYTLLDARYVDAYQTCATTPCAAPNLTIPAGNGIPGVARSAVYASMAWEPPAGWRAGVEGRALSRVFVNDSNSDAAAGFAMASAYLGYAAHVRPADITGFARVDNLLARRYSGSVIVDEGNSRYFEPATGRTLTVGVTGAVHF
jgi:iron complex outermembrane receptor protein